MNTKKKRYLQCVKTSGNLAEIFHMRKKTCIQEREMHEMLVQNFQN
jgi:hypothetical protein